MNTQSFTHDRFTWLAYIALAYFAYTHATFGPVIPFLQEKLKLSYTIAGLHFTVFAVGMIIAGVSGANIAKRWGRRAMFWGSGGGMAFATSLDDTRTSRPVNWAAGSSLTTQTVEFRSGCHGRVRSRTPRANLRARRGDNLYQR